MKLTKPQLKQFIEEAFKEAHEDVEVFSSHESPEGKVKAVINKLMKDAGIFYASLPDEKQRLLIQNFETYFNKWEQELESESEKEWELELEDKSEEELASSLALAAPVAAAVCLFHVRM